MMLNGRTRLTLHQYQPTIISTSVIITTYFQLAASLYWHRKESNILYPDGRGT